ncbi:hypothetical protein AMK26_26990 [Streptomyces sp. CB03234]|nr:hypothetical protein AMK26_26990 [Streptomyces sp. CB03234]
MVDRTVLLDVTIRDGGYINKHSWTTTQASQVIAACSAAGVPYSEVGYLRPERHALDGAEAPSASCPPAYLEKVREAAAGVGLVVMAHAKDAMPQSVARLADFGVRMVRMPTRPDQVARLAPYAEAVRGAGMEFAVNLIRVSELTEQAVAEAAQAAEKLSVDIFYLADSNGSLLPEDVIRLWGPVRENVGAVLGFHLHDGISMGFANALAAMQQGFTYIDASLSGMGKGGGNLPLELIAAYLRSRSGREFKVTPLIETAAELLKPWKGNQILARCEAMVGGILDLNMDELAELNGAGPGNVLTILDGASASR